MSSIAMSADEFRSTVLGELRNHRFPVNATFAKRFPKGASYADLEKIVKASATRRGATESDSLLSDIMFTLITGQVMTIYGDHGVGKSSGILAVHRILNEIVPGGVELLYIGPSRSVDHLTLTIATWMNRPDGTEEMVLMQGKAKEVLSGKPVIVLVEELNRLQKFQQMTAVALLGPGHMLGDHKVNFLAGFVLNNSGSDYAISSSDGLLADRSHHRRVTAADTPWMYHVAAKFPEVDLSALFDAYWSWHPEVRRLASPRFIEHATWAMTKGWDPMLSLPLTMKSDAEPRCRLREPGPDPKTPGRDVTAEAMKQLADSLGVIPRKVGVRDMLVTAVLDGQNSMIVGPPGGGKTSFTESVLIEAGFHTDDVMIMSGTTIHPDNFSATMVSRGGLHTTLVEWFKRPASGPLGKVLVLDDIYLSSPQARPALMELLQERTVASIPPTDLRAIVAISNEQNAFGAKLRGVTRPDLAMADRFSVSMLIDYSDIPFDEYLVAKYGAESKENGEIAAICVDWWKSDLNDELRGLVSPRALERLILRAIHGMKLEGALLHQDDHEGHPQPVPVDLRALRQRLADKTPTTLATVLARADEFVAAMSQSSEGDALEYHLAVHEVFEKEMVSDLVANAAALHPLLMQLAPQFKTALLSGGGSERQEAVKNILLKRF